MPTPRRPLSMPTATAPLCVVCGTAFPTAASGVVSITCGRVCSDLLCAVLKAATFNQARRLLCEKLPPRSVSPSRLATLRDYAAAFKARKFARVALTHLEVVLRKRLRTAGRPNPRLR